MVGKEALELQDTKKILDTSHDISVSFYEFTLFFAKCVVIQKLPIPIPQDFFNDSSLPSEIPNFSAGMDNFWIYTMP